MNYKNTRRGSTQIQQAVITQNIIPELVSGSSTPAVIKRQALKTLKKFQGLSYFTTARGFTLIELLVVVLIIGILAAVAVPQYQVAVGKARFANLKTVARIYARAAEVVKLETGAWPRTFEDLIVEVPGGSELSSAVLAEDTCAANEQMYCCMMGYVHKEQYNGIYCGVLDYSLLYGWEPDYKREICFAKPNTYLDQVCKSLGGKESNLSGNNLVIPGGYLQGYNRYHL